MGELKSCLFCGKHVDEAFEYCPHCGYEFGEGDELSAFGGDSATPLAGRSGSGEDHSAAGDKPGSDGMLPGLIGETAAVDREDCGGCIPEEDEGYLRRLRTLQEILSDMERELDLMIRFASKDS